MMSQRSSLRRPRAAVLLVAALAGAAVSIAAGQAPVEGTPAPVAADPAAPPIVEIPSITVGEPFPDLVLPTLDGRPMSLASLRGHRTMLHVFASW